MVVGIIGIGLIGGSFAKAYHEAGHTVYALDTDRTILEYSILAGVTRAELTDENVNDCDLLIIATYTDSIIEYTERFAPRLKKGAIVIDCNGVKTRVCKECFRIARDYDFDFVGAHPMAGSHLSFFKHSSKNMFEGVYMVLIPPGEDDVSDIRILARTKQLLEPAGFAHYKITTAEEHDRKIAYTSQMTHVMASSYIRNPSAEKHEGYSAGSFRDITRVAWINSKLWSGLLVDNKENVLRELDILIGNLLECKEAICREDVEKLESILEEGSKIRDKVGV